MPFQSEQQRRYLWRNEPEIARRWADEEKHNTFTPKQRTKLAAKHQALPDGSFPIRNEQDLLNARKAVGRSKDPAAARAHIARRAKELKLESTLPPTYTSVQKNAFGVIHKSFVKPKLARSFAGKTPAGRQNADMGAVKLSDLIAVKGKKKAIKEVKSELVRRPERIKGVRRLARKQGREANRMYRNERRLADAIEASPKSRHWGDFTFGSHVPYSTVKQFRSMYPKGRAINRRKVVVAGVKMPEDTVAAVSLGMKSKNRSLMYMPKDNLPSGHSTDVIRHEMVHAGRKKPKVLPSAKWEGGEEGRADALSGMKRNLYSDRGYSTSTVPEEVKAWSKNYRRVRAKLGKPVSPKQEKTHNKFVSDIEAIKRRMKKKGHRYE